MPETNTSPPTDDRPAEAAAGTAVATEEAAVTPPAAAPGPGPAPAGARQREDGETSAEEEPPSHDGLTPRQARRIRALISAVVMAAVAVALVLRLHSAPSVLIVGFYGVALILSGTALVLSRRGRTRVASGVLLLGFASVVLAEWLLGFAA